MNRDVCEHFNPIGLCDQCRPPARQAECPRCGKVSRPDDIHTCTPRRLTDDEIGQIWFQARIPGLTETAARLLIRAAEQWRTTR